MRPLSTIAFDDLRVGDAVISPHGTPGFISTKYRGHVWVNGTLDPDHSRIDIRWDNGRTSNYLAPYWMDQITYVG